MRHEIDLDGAIAHECRSRGVDVPIALLAERQHGVVARFQLRAIGVTPDAIRGRVESGRLHRLHRGVYAVGHRAVSREGALLAAVLAGGPGAVLSHRSAAELWELQLGKGRLIDVTVERDRRDQDGLQMHRARLEPHEITVRRCIAVTTPERTIIDLAAHLTPSALERAIRQAEYDHLTSPDSLTSCLSTYEGRRGLKRLREALNLSRETTGVDRSKLERLFLRFIRRHDLPRPRLNHRIDLPTRMVLADCAWPERRLIVELDSRSAHLNRHSFESDRARDRDLLVAGWTTTRVTWRQLHEGEDRLAGDLNALLAGD